MSPGSRVEGRALYAVAAQHLEGMPRYSIRLDRFLPLLRPLTSHGLSSRPVPELATWTPLGPGNIGGRTRVIVIDPHDPSTMFAAGVSGGIWKTTNAGESWTPVGDALANIAVNSMAMSPANSLVLYAGTGEGYFREEIRGTGLPLRGGGIFRSRDGGLTWEQLPATANEQFQWVNDLVFSPRDESRLYAATRTGVWRTTDGGASWSPILESTHRGGCLDLAIRTDRAEDVLFASCGTFEPAAVYRFDNAAIPTGPVEVLADPAMGRTSLALAPSNQDVIYAVAASNDPGPGGNYRQGLHAVYRSVVGGDLGTWTIQVANTDPIKAYTLLLTNPISAMTVECGRGSRNSITNMGWYTNTVAVDPIDPAIVWVGGVDWFRSDDGGRNWGIASHWWQRGSTYAHADQHVMVFHPRYDGHANQTAYVGGDGGLYRTDNARGPTGDNMLGPCTPSASGVFWTSLNRDYGVTQFYHGLPFPDGDRFIAGAQDNGTLIGSIAGGANGWQSVLGGDGGYVAIDPTNPQIIYAETQWAAIRKSTNGGRTFSAATSGLDPARSDTLGTDTNYNFITPFTMDPSDPRTLWTGGQFIFRTTNAAATWTRASAELYDGGKVSAVTVAPSDSNRVAVGTSNGWVYVTDEGRTASAATPWRAVRPREGWVTWVAFDPRDADVLYVTYGWFGGAHVFRSTNGGATWQAIDGAGPGRLPDIPVHAVVVDPVDTRRLYLGTDLGVFVSIDGGAQWAVENTGFGAIVTESLTLLRRADGRDALYAFTHGRGAWLVEIPRSVVVSSEPDTRKGR